MKKSEQPKAGTNWIIVDDDGWWKEHGVVLTGNGFQGGVRMARRFRDEKPDERRSAIHLYVEQEFD